MYRLAVFLFAWCLLKHDERFGGKHQDVTAGVTIVQVRGQRYSLRWLLHINDSTMHMPNDASARFAEFSRRMDRAEVREKSFR